jgi:hypothetical protein
VQGERGFTGRQSEPLQPNCCCAANTLAYIGCAKGEQDAVLELEFRTSDALLCKGLQMSRSRGSVQNTRPVGMLTC